MRPATLWLLSVLLPACTGGTPGGTIEYDLTAIDTLLAPEHPLLDKPAELALDAERLLYVADVGANRILVLDSLGRLVRRIGKEGSGPGELRWPRALQVGGDTLRVLDGGNGRFAVFRPDGGLVRTYLAPGRVLSSAVSIGPDGAAVIGLGGQDNVLAQRVAPSGQLGSTFGRPVAPVPPFWDFAAIKKRIREGQVPAELRNLTLPVLGPDRSVWLGLSAEGVVERYSAQDSLLWQVQLDEPEFAAIREDFFRRNRADSAANRLFPLSIFVAAQPVGGNLWLLLRQPESAPTILLILDPLGSVRARVRLPGARGIRGFAVDPGRSLLYLLAYEDAALLRVRLPESWFGAT